MGATSPKGKLALSRGQPDRARMNVSSHSRLNLAMPAAEQLRGKVARHLPSALPQTEAEIGSTSGALIKIGPMFAVKG